MFTSDQVYFINGTVYDYYSIDEFLNHSGPGSQWKIFPLPNEDSLISPTTSVENTTGLAYVDHIYVTSTSKLADRRANLERMFTRYQIRNYEWRMKWTQDNCQAPENRNEVFQKMNLRVNSLRKNHFFIRTWIWNILSDNPKQKRLCAITMEHIDIWHDIVARNSSLSLILEDDAVFVSNFAEKFNRSILAALRTGILKMNGLLPCMMNKSSLSPESKEWVNQDPMIVIGNCMRLHDNAFAKDRRDASPMWSTHKEWASRCSHAYLLTACSANALLRQIVNRKLTFVPSDLLLNALVIASPTLQSFWLDPPIVYQGNRIVDLDGIPSFRQTTY